MARPRRPETEATEPPRIILRLLDALIPYANNPKAHPAKQVDQIAASLKRFGWTNPVLVDGGGGIIAGHGRVLAAKKLRVAGAMIPNWPDTASVPTIELAHLTEADHRAYRIADNRISENAEWLDGELGLELLGLQELEFPLGLLGFDGRELGRLLQEIDGIASPSQEEVEIVGSVTRYEVSVMCKDELEQRLVFERMVAEGYKCRALAL